MTWIQHTDEDGNSYWRANSKLPPEEFGEDQDWQVEQRIRNNTIVWTLDASDEDPLLICGVTEFESATEAMRYVERTEDMYLAVLNGQSED